MAKVRVHELAKEYGVESRVILAKLKEMGEFVKSASSTVEPRIVQRLEDQYGEDLRGTPYTPTMPAGWYDEKGAGPNPFSTPSQDSKLAEAAAVLEVPAHQLKLAPQPRARRLRTWPAAKPLTSWERNLFDKTDRAAWMAAGLGPGEGDLALRLTEKGLTPADLSLPVRGMRASARLRGGEPLHMVIREMVEAKAQRRAS